MHSTITSFNTGAIFRIVSKIDPFMNCLPYLIFFGKLNWHKWLNVLNRIHLENWRFLSHCFWNNSDVLTLSAINLLAKNSGYQTRPSNRFYCYTSSFRGKWWRLERVLLKLVNLSQWNSSWLDFYAISTMYFEWKKHTGIVISRRPLSTSIYWVLKRNNEIFYFIFLMINRV